jgi:hypothetical protein
MHSILQCRCISLTWTLKTAMSHKGWTSLKFVCDVKFSCIKKQFIQLTGIENWTKTLLQVAFGPLVCIFQFPSSAAHTTCYKFSVKGDASMHSRIENYCLGLGEGELTVSKKLAQTYIRYSGKLSASDSHVSHSRPTNWKGIWRCSTIFYCVTHKWKYFLNYGYVWEGHSTNTGKFYMLGSLKWEQLDSCTSRTRRQFNQRNANCRNSSPSCSKCFTTGSANLKTCKQLSLQTIVILWYGTKH